MAEQTTLTGAGTSGGTARGDTPKSFSEQAMEAGRELKDKAVELAETSTDKLKDQASELGSAAKDMAGQATDKVKEAVSERKNAGADYVTSLAETIRRAGREFDNDLPIAGKYIRKAASQVDNFAELGPHWGLQRSSAQFAIVCQAAAHRLSRHRRACGFCRSSIFEELIGRLRIVIGKSSGPASTGVKNGVSR